MRIELLAGDRSIEVIGGVQVDAQRRFDRYAGWRGANPHRPGPDRACRRAASLIDCVSAYRVGVVVCRVQVLATGIDGHSDREETRAERSIHHGHKNTRGLDDVSDQLVRSLVRHVHEVALGVFGDGARGYAGREALGDGWATGNRRPNRRSGDRGERTRGGIAREPEDGGVGRSLLIDDVDVVVEGVRDDCDGVVADVLVEGRSKAVIGIDREDADAAGAGNRGRIAGLIRIGHIEELAGGIDGRRSREVACDLVDILRGEGAVGSDGELLHG